MVIVFILVLSLLCWIDILIFLSFVSFFKITFLLLSQALTAIIGFYFIKKIGLKTYFFVDAEIKKGEKIVIELWHEVLILFGSIFLLMPGFLSDILGGIMFVESARIYILEYLIQESKKS